MKRVKAAKSKLTAIVDVIEIVLMGAFYIIGAWWMDHLTIIEWYWVIFVLCRLFWVSYSAARWSVSVWKGPGYFWPGKKNWLRGLGFISVLALIAGVVLLETNYGFLSRHKVEAFILGGSLGFFGLCFLLGWIVSKSES